MDAFSEIVEPLIIAALLACMVGGPAYARYRRKNRTPGMANAPVLMSYYTEGADEMVQLRAGKVGDLEFQAMLILGNHDGVIDKGNALLYRVELPFTTKLHLLGIPKKRGATQLNPVGGMMERVTLEGDYNKHFSLYAEKAMQQQSRYILDPKAMVFTVDFCQSHSWEIIGDELYFVQDSTQASDDPTLMHDDVAKFVEEIRPAIAEPASHHERKLHPGVTRQTLKVNCPVCHAPLTPESGAYRCPNQHGLLLKGIEITKVKAGTIANPATPTPPAERTTDIPCPACGHDMVRVAYGGSPITIDSCIHCPYRWLDAGELISKQRIYQQSASKN